MSMSGFMQSDTSCCSSKSVAAGDCCGPHACAAPTLLTTSDSSMLSSGAITLLRPVGGTAGANAMADGKLGSAPASASTSLTLHNVHLAEEPADGHRDDLTAPSGMPIYWEVDRLS